MAEKKTRPEQRKPRLRVLVVRHGIAEDRTEFATSGRPDALRPLSKAGRRKTRRAARGVEGLVGRVDAIASSPLARAVQTAELLADRLGKPRVVRLAALAPEKSQQQAMDWLREQASRTPGARVALVGHEPNLGQLVSWMLTGLRESFAPMKKGGACLLEFAGEVKPGRAKLAWAMKPGQLRRLAPR